MDLLWGETQFWFWKAEQTAMLCAVQWKIPDLPNQSYCMTLLRAFYHEKVTNIVIHKSRTFMGAADIQTFSLFEYLQTA